MAGATFGRKGVAGGEIAAPRRATFGAARPAFAPAPADPDDPYAEQRAAFLAAERARRGDAAAQADETLRRAAAAPRPAQPQEPPFPGRKKAGIAYVLWFVLGAMSAHRLYLGRPLSALGQWALWYVSFVFYMAGHAIAAAPMAAGLLWLIVDGYALPGMVRDTNDGLRRRLAAQGDLPAG